MSTKILDLDLDFFVRPVAHWRFGGSRLDSKAYHCATQSEVEDFLERRCGLSKSQRIPGRLCVEHNEAFDIWKAWIANKEVSVPFEVVHVDAHADMGLGDSSWTYLTTELLALPVEQRGNPARGSNGLNSGSYLAFAIANRWIERMTYVYSSESEVDDGGCPMDVLPFYFRNQDWAHGPIELPHLRNEQVTDILMRADGKVNASSWEPPVPNAYRHPEEFITSGFTHLLLAQSPSFTPLEADDLISVIAQYFHTMSGE